MTIVSPLTQPTPLRKLGSLRAAADETVRAIRMQARRVRADMVEDEALFATCACRRETDLVFLVLLLRRLEAIADAAADACADESLADLAASFQQETEPLSGLRNVLRHSEGYSQSWCDPHAPVLHWIGRGDGTALYYERRQFGTEAELVAQVLDLDALTGSAERLASLTLDALATELDRHGE